jgi:hypothetical protein
MRFNFLVVTAFIISSQPAVAQGEREQGVLFSRRT